MGDGDMTDSANSSVQIRLDVPYGGAANGSIHKYWDGAQFRKFLPVAAAGRSLDQSVSLYKSIAFCRVTLRFVSSEMPSNC